MKETLLDLDRVPTLDEMIAFFKKNDWTTTKVYTDDERTPEMNAEIAYMKKLMDKKYDPLAKEMGRKKHPSCYSKDHPLMKLQDGTAEVVACLTEKLIDEHWDIAEGILQDFNLFTAPDIHEKADDFLNNVVRTAMQVMEYDKIAEITEETKAHTDYSNLKNNYPKKDFYKKWNHYDKKHEEISFDTLSEAEMLEGTEGHSSDKELLVEAAGKFWVLLNDEEKAIMKYRISSWDYDVIAEQLGYKTHSAIVKKRQKIESKFKKFLKEEYNFT